MSDHSPIPTPERLPAKITPCPIVEAILEIRFVTSESWRTLPGLLYAKIRERYPEQRDLSLASYPGWTALEKEMTCCWRNFNNAVSSAKVSDWLCVVLRCFRWNGARRVHAVSWFGVTFGVSPSPRRRQTWSKSGC